MSTRDLARLLLLGVACIFVAPPSPAAESPGPAHAAAARSAARSRAPAPPAIRIVVATAERGLSYVPVDLSAVVLDLFGRQVERVPARAVAADQGVLTLTWDGMRGGVPAPPGVYRVRVHAPSLSLRTERLLVVR